MSKAKADKVNLNDFVMGYNNASKDIQGLWNACKAKYISEAFFDYILLKMAKEK